MGGADATNGTHVGTEPLMRRILGALGGETQSDTLGNLLCLSCGDIDPRLGFATTPAMHLRFEGSVCAGVLRLEGLGLEEKGCLIELLKLVDLDKGGDSILAELTLESLLGPLLGEGRCAVPPILCKDLRLGKGRLLCPLTLLI